MELTTEQTRCAGSDVQVPVGAPERLGHFRCGGCLEFVPVHDFDGVRFVEHQRTVLYAQEPATA